MVLYVSFSKEETHVFLENIFQKAASDVTGRYVLGELHKTARELSHFA